MVIRLDPAVTRLREAALRLHRRTATTRNQPRLRRLVEQGVLEARRYPFAPLVALGSATIVVVIKSLPLLYEDVDDRGDDIGILITVLILAVIWSVIYFRSGCQIEAGQATRS